MGLAFIAPVTAVVFWPFSTYQCRVSSFLSALWISLPPPVSLVPFLSLPVPVLKHSLKCQFHLPVSSYDCVTTYYAINKLNLVNPSHLNLTMSLVSILELLSDSMTQLLKALLSSYLHSCYSFCFKYPSTCLQELSDLSL